MPFSCESVGGSERVERFATCPPAFGLLLYLRKALSPLALGDMYSRALLKPPFAATSVACPPQRSKGGDRVAGGGHERRWARRDRCGLSKTGCTPNLNFIP
jgi:hypothetical protein